MKVALDIDGTISEHPEFFAVLSSALRAAGHLVVVLTYRDPARAEATNAQLAGWGIGFDELVIAPSLEAKGELCGALGIDLFFDDQDECIATQVLGKDARWPLLVCAPSQVHLATGKVRTGFSDSCCLKSKRFILSMRRNVSLVSRSLLSM